MNPRTPAAYGVFSSDFEPRQVIANLKQSGCYNDEICMLVAPKHPIASLMRDAGRLQGLGDSEPTVKSMLVWLMKLGAVAIPTIGLFVHSKAFVPAFVTEKESAVGYGNSTALIGLGFSESDALRLEFQLRDAAVLIYVTCPEIGKSALVRETFRRIGARETAVLGKQMVKQAVVA